MSEPSFWKRAAEAMHSVSPAWPPPHDARDCPECDHAIALRQIADKAWDTNDECRWCFQDFPDGHLGECPAAIAEVTLAAPPSKKVGA